MDLTDLHRLPSFSRGQNWYWPTMASKDVARISVEMRRRIVDAVVFVIVVVVVHSALPPERLRDDCGGNWN